MESKNYLNFEDWKKSEKKIEKQLSFILMMFLLILIYFLVTGRVEEVGEDFGDKGFVYIAFLSISGIIIGFIYKLLKKEPEQYLKEEYVEYVEKEVSFIESQEKELKKINEDFKKYNYD